MTSKRSITLTVSALVLLFPLYKLVQACGGWIDPYDYYPQFFTPPVTQQPAFLPFHYTSQVLYYDEGYALEPGDAMPDANIAAWKSYTGGTVSSPDLDSFIYAYPHSALSNLYYHLEKGKPLQVSPEVERNAFTRWLKGSKDLEALGYLMYAKQCEPFAAAGSDWELPQRDTAKMSRLIRNGLQLHAAAKNEAIRERYAFQVLRLALYSGKYLQTLELYTKLIGDERTSGSAIFARCLELKAGALFRLGRKTEAAYLYSLVFDMSDGRRRSSFLSFDWSTTADVSPVLALCKTPHEKAVVHVMDGLNNYEQALPQIRTAYALDPEVAGLDVLFTREINKVEERYLQEELLDARNIRPESWQYNHYVGEYTERSPERASMAAAWKAYAATLAGFAQKAAGEAPAGRKAFWQLASAYLGYVQMDDGTTRRYLDLAAKSPMNAHERDLYELISALRVIRIHGGMNAKAEAELLPLMRKLDARGAASPGKDKVYRDLLSTVITAGYLQRGDTMRAVYALARSNRSGGTLYVADDFTDLPGSLLERMAPQKLQELQRFINGTGKSRWDAWLTAGTPYTTDVLKELEGTKYLRRKQFGTAAQTLARLSRAGQEKYFLPNPFIARVRDFMEYEAGDSSRIYTKLSFARRMDSLSRRNDAAGLFEYGCGLYGMSYYGKAYHAWAYYRFSMDGLAYYDSPERQRLPDDEREFYSLEDAEQQFIKAAQQSKDPELRAKCLWMAGKCWQKRCRPEVSDDGKAYYLNSLKNPYFAQLESLAATPFMKKAHSTCGYLRDYVSGKR